MLDPQVHKNRIAKLDALEKQSLYRYSTALAGNTIGRWTIAYTKGDWIARMLGSIPKTSFTILYVTVAAASLRVLIQQQPYGNKDMFYKWTLKGFRPSYEVDDLYQWSIKDGQRYLPQDFRVYDSIRSWMEAGQRAHYKVVAGAVLDTMFKPGFGNDYLCDPPD